MDAIGSVHSDAAPGHAHPVGKGSAHVFVARAAVLAAITAVDAFSFVIGGAKDGGSFVDDFFTDAVGLGRGWFSGAPGADGGVDGDRIVGPDEELGALFAEVDADFGVVRGGGIVGGLVLVDRHGCAVVFSGFEGWIGTANDFGLGWCAGGGAGIGATGESESHEGSDDGKEDFFHEC